MPEGMEIAGGGGKGEEWDNCNSIINKIYLKKRNSIKLSFINWQSVVKKL